MTAGELVAIIVAVGGFVTAIYTQRNSATRDSATRRNAEIDAQFERLNAENAQQGLALAAVREENTRLFAEVVEMRRELRAKDDEIFTLRRDLTVEKARTTALEAQVSVLTAERDAAIETANGGKPKPGTGPLKE